MTRILLTAASLAFGISAATAECAYHNTVSASTPDKTVVASAGDTALPATAPISDEAPASDQTPKGQEVKAR